MAMVREYFEKLAAAHKSIRREDSCLMGVREIL